MAHAQRAVTVARPHWVDELVAELRTKAKTYADDGAEGPARVYARVADSIEQRRQAYEGEALSLAQAATESGFTESTLRRWRGEGVLPSDADGRVARRDLPRKAGHGIEQQPRRFRLVGSGVVASSAAIADLARDILG